MGKKFATPKTTYSSVIQSATTEKASNRKEVYRFNMNFDYELHDYLQEMAWRNRMTITEYLNKIVREDMEKHPEWTQTVDVLNSK